MDKQRKKLTLNKETLRDLTAQNAREVKAGSASHCVPSCICTYNCPTIGCTLATCKCHGQTYNKKC